MEKLTFGQKLVGVDLHSPDTAAGRIKQTFADLIDVIGDPTQDKERRSWSYNVIRTGAIKSAVDCCMAFVKFLTWKEQ